MRIEVGFGDGTQSCEVGEKNLGLVLQQNQVPVELTGQAEVARALATPLGAPRLVQLARPGQRVAIVTSDVTRPLPTWEVLPPVLDELWAAGVDPADVTVVFALGSHRLQTPEEQRRLAGEQAWAQVRCVDSAACAFEHVGQTRRGTPVDIAAPVATADLVVCLGNVEFHYFAGYSGGAKAIFPGCSTPEAIAHNHAMMSDPAARAGQLAGNPVREDLEEAAALVGADFVVNVVLDEEKRIVHAAAGDMTAAHREACAYLDCLYRIDIPRRFDIVIDSQGGAPKDLNLYQTQKALDNAQYAVRPGGVVILVGCCREGFGNATFERWMREATCPDDLLERVVSRFELGGHKASAVAKLMKLADVYLVSQMDPALVREALFTPFATLEEAYAAALAKMGPDAQVLVMPHGGSTVPHVVGE